MKRIYFIGFFLPQRAQRTQRRRKERKMDIG